MAGGAVNIGGTVIVTDLEIGTAGSDFLKENVQLTDGTAIAVDGSARPTLDIRAGVAPAQINNPGITGITPSLTYS